MTVRRGGLLLAMLVVLAGCASTVPVTTGAGSAGTSVSQAAGGTTVPAPAAITSMPPDAAPAGTVTESMHRLGIAGETWASEGNPDAAVTVVEFSDYGCPFCGAYIRSTYPVLKQRFIDTGKIFYVYKDFPVVQLHPQAELAAEAAECAGDQRKYWPMHDLLFANQKSWDTTAEAATAAFGRYATQIGLDQALFVRCTSAHQHAAEIDADIAQGKALGTNGTPTFIINGKQLVGAQPTEAFINAITNELNHPQ